MNSVRIDDDCTISSQAEAQANHLGLNQNINQLKQLVPPSLTQVQQRESPTSDPMSQKLTTPSICTDQESELKLRPSQPLHSSSLEIKTSHLKRGRAADDHSILTFHTWRSSGPCGSRIFSILLRLYFPLHSSGGSRILYENLAICILYMISCQSRVKKYWVPPSGWKVSARSQSKHNEISQSLLSSIIWVRQCPSKCWLIPRCYGDLLKICILYNPS